MNLEPPLTSNSGASTAPEHTDLRAELESEMKAAFRELLVAQKALSSPTIDSLMSLLNSSGPTSAEILLALSASSPDGGGATND